MAIKFSKRVKNAMLDYGYRAPEVTTVIHEDILRVIAIMALDDGKEITIQNEQWNRAGEDVVLVVRETMAGELIVKREVAHAQEEAKGQ